MRPWLSVLGLVSVGVLAWGYSVDDAYIVGRYALNLAGGAGYVMNPGAAWTDGVTGPLWLLPGTLAALLGADPVVAAKGAGLCCMAAAVWLTVSAAAERTGGRLGACVTALMLALQPTIGTWAVAGLETGAATLGAVVLWRAVLGPAGPAGWRAGAACAVLAWLRPELAVYAAVWVACLWCRARGAAVRALVVGGAGAVALLAFRWLCFGAALPLSLAAKPAELAHGVDYIWRCLWITTGLLGLWLPVRAVLGGQLRDRLLALAIGAHLLALGLAGGDWMPGLRLLAPVLPGYAYLCGVGFARAWRTRARGGGSRGAVVACAALVVGLALPGIDLALRIPEAARSAAAREGPGAALADTLRGLPGPVALVDVGFLAYRSGAEVVDLGGVTDPRIGRLPGGHLGKRVPPALLRARGTAAVVLHADRPPEVRGGVLRSLAGFAVERRLAASPWLRAGFEVAAQFHYAPGVHYVLLRRANAAGSEPRSEAVGEGEERQPDRVQ